MKKKDIQKLKQELEPFPPKMQDAFWQMIANINVAKELCKGPKMSEDKIELFSQKALEQEDYLTFWLIYYKKITDQHKHSK